MKPLFLVGYMASGKTSYGRQIADFLGLPFIDMDDKVMQLAGGRPVSAIFAREGEEGFRRLEREALLQLLGKSDCVIATGGGTPCFYDNMELMNRHGTTLWLDASPASICRYLSQQRGDRPLLARLSDEELLQHVERHLAERKPFYSLASRHVRLD